jgi:hypothetical protein
MPTRASTVAARLADRPAESSLGRYAAPKRAVFVADRLPFVRLGGELGRQRPVRARWS